MRQGRILSWNNRNQPDLAGDRQGEYRCRRDIRVLCPWNDRVPDNYFIQVLHYLNVTGFSFAYLFAELTYSDDLQMTKTFKFDRNNLVEDIEYLQEKEIEFWKYVEEDKRPPLVLPMI